MGLINSPKIVTDGLVFAYDMNNYAKSWKGEPTTNIMPDPANNGRFTTSNGWGTYNTNQYNGAQYFSIGTVSSVTDNIVTMTGSHPLRTYDVVQCQTSGGGLSSGTNYFIKKISATQFSVHSYNGSQNGSQGYINTATGYHKVHDTIALDQRVSINASGFPTMWWGPPHLPNSGLVKEIVEGVGPQGQSVMRLHVHRTDGVADGMAYGVYTPVTAGQVINVSYWQRTNYPGKSLGYSTYFWGNSAYGSGYTPPDDKWHRVSFQWTSSYTQFIQYWWPDGTTDRPYWTDICDLQVEVNTQSGDTPFTIGSRSNTQAIVDMIGTNTITANSLTYNSDGSFNFNGSSNYLSNSPNIIKTGGGWTVENWFKLDVVNSGSLYNFIGDSSILYNSWYWTVFQSKLALWNISPGTWRYGSTTIQPNVWYCAAIVCSDTGTSYQFYLNGVAEGGDHTTYSWNSSYASLQMGYIGRGDTSNGRYFDGLLPNMKVYDRALNSTEIKQNFNALRGRYGI